MDRAQVDTGPAEDLRQAVVRAPADRLIAAVAAQQHGVVSRAQLTEAGLGRGAIAHRVAQGRLHRLHRGVYLVGHPVPPEHAPLCAAVLACGPGAHLSHVAAAGLWGMLRAGGPSIDVTVAGRNCAHRQGIRVHRVRRLHPRDTRRRHGIPLTAPARTILDLASVLPRRDLERALEEARLLRLTSGTEIRGAIERAPGARGRAVLLRLLAVSGTPSLTRSEAERRLLSLVRAAGLPPPQTNVRVCGYEVDFLWRAERLIVEVDGYAFHASRVAFERDRRRDSELLVAGLRVLRLTWQRITGEPEATVAALARALVSSTK